MCEILGIIGGDTSELPARSFTNAHLEIEAERRAFVDRNTQVGGPAFVPSGRPIVVVGSTGGRAAAAHAMASGCRVRGAGDFRSRDARAAPSVWLHR